MKKLNIAKPFSSIFTVTLYTVQDHLQYVQYVLKAYIILMHMNILSLDF